MPGTQKNCYPEKWFLHLKKFFFTFLAFILIPKSPYSQSVASHILQTKKGYTRIYNGEGECFSLSYSGDSIRALPGDITEIDGDLFQFRLVPANPDYAKVLPVTERSGNDYLDVVKGFIGYEVDRLQNQVLMNPAQFQVEEFRMMNGRSWFLWSYTIPENLKADQRAKGQIPIEKNFLITTLANTTLFSFAVPLFEGKSEISLIQKLKALASGIEVYPSPIDIEILSQRFGRKAPYGIFFAHPLNCESGFLSPESFQFLPYGSQGNLRGIFPEWEYQFCNLEMYCWNREEFSDLATLNASFMKILKGGEAIPNPYQGKSMLYEIKNLPAQDGPHRTRWFSFESSKGYGMLLFDCPESSFSHFESQMDDLIRNLEIE